jgi:hypothetical protein
MRVPRALEARTEVRRHNSSLQRTGLGLCTARGRAVRVDVSQARFVVRWSAAELNR